MWVKTEEGELVNLAGVQRVTTYASSGGGDLGICAFYSISTKFEDAEILCTYESGKVIERVMEKLYRALHRGDAAFDINRAIMQVRDNVGDDDKGDS